MDCVALGDEAASRMAFEMNCRDRTVVGRTAFDQAALMRDVRSDLVLISLGDNKPCKGCKDPNLFVDLRYIRSRVVAKQVVWVLPRDVEAARVVRRIAGAYGDRVARINRK